MVLPFALPAWVPAWVQLVLLVSVVLVAGAFVLMPFSVFGLKARLDALDQRLDDLQADLRELSYRLPDPEMRRVAAWRRADPEDDQFVARPQPVRPDPRRDETPSRPPIPPAPMVPDRERERPAAAPTPNPRSRAEPQLRWPIDRGHE